MKPGQKLTLKLIPKSFFKNDAVYVAQKLLGKVIKLGNCSGMIVETEAYKSDEASHGAKRTERSDIMYSSYGHWYVYLIYGMYNCVNITTNEIDKPGAVLIRALEPVEGIRDMMKRRSKEKKGTRKVTDRERKENIKIHNLCSGPGKLCSALNINKAHNGLEVNDQIQICNYKNFKTNQIQSSGRIGIQKAKDLEWRFYVKGNEFVSSRV